MSQSSVRTAKSVSGLLEASQSLRASFSIDTNSQPAAATASYLSAMTVFEHECAGINVTRNHSSSTTSTARIAPVCEQLVPLAQHNHEAYEAIRPLLLLTTKKKYYHLLPGISQWTRERDLALIQAAQSSLATIDSSPATSVLPLVKQLHADTQKSRSLDYFSAVSQFQSDALSVGHRYWNSYADIDGLVSTLMREQREQCSLLTPHERFVAACPTTK